MLNRQTPKQYAFSLLKKYGIIKPTLNNIIFLIEESGYEVVDYDAETIVDDTTDEALGKHLSTSVAFSYSNGKTKIVFFNDCLSEQEKLLVAAHELGHICLGHLDHRSDSSPQEEFEANEFAHYLLNPHLCIRLYSFVKSYQKETAIGLACFAFLLVVSLIGVKIYQNKIYYEKYYVCEHGDKYHLAECPFITSSSNYHRLTKEEYSTRQYEPCAVCMENN